MTNNDILRRIKEVFNYDVNKVVSVFALAEHGVAETDIEDWLRREDDPAYGVLYDDELAAFLNGLIIENRGKKEGSLPRPEKKLTNNMVLKKLQIALNYRADHILKALALAGHEMNKYELSAVFRKPDHRHYRPLRNQVLRQFLKGVEIKNAGRDQA